MNDTEENRQLVEDYIKQKLIMRGFSENQLLNNRGLIGATIEELVLLVGFKNLGIARKI